MQAHIGEANVKVGLVGVSHWHAGMHAHAVTSAGATLLGVWDEDAGVAQKFADAYRARSVDLATIKTEADLIVVMGRPDRVPELAASLIVAGEPIILEKPAAVRTADLEMLAAQALAHNTFVAVPLPNRLGPAMVEYRLLSEAGRAGAIAHAHFRIVNGPPQRYRDDGVGWMLDPAISGGGALRNLGIHGVDAALALASGKLSLRSASIRRSIHKSEAVEDHALLILTDETGALFTVEAGYTYASMQAGGDFEWRIDAANSYLIDTGDAAFAATLDDGKRRSLTPLPLSVRYDAFTADTLARLQAGEPPSVGIADYVRAMRLIDLAYEEALR
jgi:predicted dehydrogenase